MKLLWIIPECPYPANTGGKQGIWNRIVQMSFTNDIHLFCVADSEEEAEASEDEILKYCKSVKFYVRKKRLSVLLKSLVFPYAAVSKWFKSMRRDVEKASEEFKPEFVLCDFPQVIGNLSKNVRTDNKIVLFQGNIEYLTMKSIAECTVSFMKKIAFSIMAKQMEIYENTIYKKSFIDLYSFVSITDKEFFEKKYHITSTNLIPVGANVSNELRISNKKQLIFVGKMSYAPNNSAVLWFIENVWSEVIKRVPDAKFYVIGKEPSEEVLKMASQYSSIIVTGLVEDVEPYYNDASAVVVPIENGGGVKVKLLEALGQGCLVIATANGIKGTDFVPDKHLLMASNAEMYIDYCVEALENPGKFAEIRNNALDKMKDEYSWKTIVAKYEKELKALMDKEGL